MWKTNDPRQIISYLDNYIAKNTNVLDKATFEYELLKIRLSDYIVTPTKAIAFKHNAMNEWNRLTLDTDVTIVDNEVNAEQYLFGCILQNISDVISVDTWNNIIHNESKLNTDIKKQLRTMYFAIETLKDLIVQKWVDNKLPLILKTDALLPVLKEFPYLKKKYVLIDSNISNRSVEIQSYKNSVNDNVISQLQLRLEKIECCWDEFNDLQAELEIVAPSESDVIERKLDSVTKRDWEAYKYDGKIPTMADMNNFLKERCEMLEKLANGKLDNGIQKFSKGRGTSNSLVTNTNSLKCYFCKESHAIYNCMSLLNLPVEKRIDEVKRSKLCINCLKPAHKSWQCKAKRCFKCNKLHNSLLHLENPITTKDNINHERNLEETDPVTNDVANFTCSNQLVSFNQVLLSTALVKISVKGRIFKVRVLLDSGSQSNFITQELCDQLNLRRVPIDHTVEGVGQHITKINNQATVHFMSNDETFTMTINCMVIPKITDKLPTKSFESSVENLGNSRNIALQRFYKLERRLRNEPELNSQYTEFMHEYEQLGHMVEIDEKSGQMPSCYLPHHAVVKQSSITTKCRVVFDASSKTESGLSLNDVQYTGPALQNNIRIFWRPNPDEKLKCFELNTVTYGTASAPYLAVKCLRQIAKEIRNSYPSISKIIANDFYVDDLLTGTDSLTELVEVQRQVTEILARYGFELRKWFCNDTNIINDVRGSGVSPKKKHLVLRAGSTTSTQLQVDQIITALLQGELSIIINTSSKPGAGSSLLSFKMTEVQALALKRGRVKSNLTRFSTYLNKLTSQLSSATFEQLKLRLASSTLLLEQYNQIQEQIDLIENQIDVSTSETEEFENLYYSLVATGTSLVNEYTKSHENITHTVAFHGPDSNCSQNFPGIKLPTINLPTFTGQYSKWLEFYDTFNSLIHTNESLNCIQKFHYLKSSLKHEASTVIQSLEVSEANYPIAWKTLCERFGNSRLIINSHDRMLQAKRSKLCYNCLRKRHGTAECKASNCRKCKQKHNTLLHSNESQSQNTNIDTISNQPQPSTSLSASGSWSSNHVNHVLLCTACVKVYNRRGQKFTCRVLLDSGSQSNFITERMCNLLSLKKHPTNSSIRGINQALLPIRFNTKVSISSLIDDFQQEIPCLILNEITDKLPAITFDPSNLNIPSDISLADPNFYKSDTIDMLIGSQFFWQLMADGHIELGKNLPMLQKTRLGWIISGPMPMASSSNSPCTLCSFNELNDQLSKFWSIEEFPTPQHSAEEQLCEDLFNSTTRRSIEGRFIVKIPFIKPVTELGESKQFAIKRQLSLERKLEKNINLAADYKGFMHEYKALGHMSLTTENQHSSQSHFYLPHHAVIKEESTTTKLRIVFDGSSKSSTGVSLNDIQGAGPALQQDLISQILIYPSQRSMQQIVWRDDVHQLLETFKLNTVTYGTTSAPFLAMRCLKQLAIENKLQFPQACEAINNDFYVDDLLTGSQSEQELISLSKNIDAVLKQACFELRKWNSNSHHVLQSLSAEVNNEDPIIQLGGSSKILGIIWLPSEDLLQYNIKVPSPTKATKRSVLSTIAQVYDPLGLVSPVITNVKILIQKLWEAKLGWDEAIPFQLSRIWKTFLQELPSLNNLKIPRKVFDQSACLIQLHGFCDAFNSAYGACVYVRTVNQLNEVATHLICSKSKVAPLKTISLPRLELSGALLLAQLVEKVCKSIKLNFHSVYYWCDSTIALAWIRAAPQKWQTFVANRVASIQNISNSENWHHVRSYDNPADLVSRGTSPNNLINNMLRWSGPSWLTQHHSLWPTQDVDNEPIDTTLLEARKTTISCSSTTIQTVFNNYSSYAKLKRVIAYILRFVKNCKLPKHQRTYKGLSVDELKNSELVILKNVQIQSFSNDYHNLQRSKPLNNKSKLLSLNPFLDSSGLLRVGGRLTQSNFSYDKRHPVIIPQSHHVSDIIARNEHIRLLHCGPQTLLASLRDRYWPISGRNLTRKICRNCVTCFRVNPIPTNQLMGNLPSFRTQPTRPFLKCGVDYCGPFFIKDRKTRGAKLMKSYVCLFICLVTKAIHLELVCDLTTDSFLSSLRRFMSRRGVCSDIYSDNATNFVGARNELRELYEFLSKENESVRNTLVNEKVSWHFIPPKSPHFGGLWEAGVKKTKYHIKRVLGNTKFTYEEFYTALVQIEASINSRPLSPLSNSPDDLVPLTPAHFLIGDKLTAVPDPMHSTPSSTLTCISCICWYKYKKYNAISGNDGRKNSSLNYNNGRVGKLRHPSHYRQEIWLSSKKTTSPH
ncbi:hypothetical protein Trydic_g8746 [Trypoxylus dichotomus]